MSGGYLLRTRIRAAVEYLDQMYQYGNAGDIRTRQLAAETYAEDAEDAPALDDLEQIDL